MITTWDGGGLKLGSWAAGQLGRCMLSLKSLIFVFSLSYGFFSCLHLVPGLEAGSAILTRKAIHFDTCDAMSDAVMPLSKLLVENEEETSSAPIMLNWVQTSLTAAHKCKATTT